MTAPALDQVAGEPAPMAVDPLILEAGALAEAGAIDLGAIPCAIGGCGVPEALHADELGHPHLIPPAYALALAALEAEGRGWMDVVADGLAAEYRPSGSKSPRPSDAGACERSVWYRTRPPAGYVPRTDIDRKKAALGSIIHKAGETYRPVAFPWRRFEMAIRVPGLDGTYKIDEYDPITGTVYDTKSAGDAKWLILADGPVDDMWEQLRTYAWALYRAGYPVRRLCIVIVNRENGRDEQHWEDFDPDVCMAAVGKLVALGTALDAGVIPDRAGRGPRDWRCQWCEAMRHCWNVDEADRLGRGPVSLTLLGAEPGEAAIVWAAREFLKASKTANEAKARADFLKDLLQGLPTGPYGADREDGGVEITNHTSTSVDYKGAYEYLLELWDLPEDQRPPAMLLPGPKSKKSITQTAKTPRKATTPAGKRKPAKSPATKAAEKATAIAGGED